MRKVLLVLSVMLLSIATLFAAQEMSVTWEWLLDDPAVNYYRYQLNGTDDDAWTVVSGDTSSYTADGLDPYADYTLYLQRSYDGENWSETASATAEALLYLEVETTPITDPLTVVDESSEEVVAEEEVVVEEIAPAEDVVAEEETAETEEVVTEEPVAEVEETVTEEVAVEEEVVTEETVVVAPMAPISLAEEKGAFEFSLLLRPYAAVNFNYGEKDPYMSSGVGLGLSFDFDNIAAFNANSGFGMRLDIGSTQYPSGGFRQHLGDGKAAEFWNWKWGELFDFANNYANDVNATLLLTIDAQAGVADFSFGLGGGAAVLFSKGDDVNKSAYNFSLADDIDLAAYAAANFGVKFYCGSVFSIGVDAVYKVMIPNYEINTLDASLVLGFTF